MADILFVEWCAKDALDGMNQMSPMTELAYRRIIDMIYATNDQLFDDDKVLQYSTKTGVKWKAIKKELLEIHRKIFVEDGKIRVKVCTEKLEKSRVKIAQSSNAGKSSAEKRKALKEKETGSTGVEIPFDENTSKTSTGGSTNHLTNNQERKNTHTSATAEGENRTPDAVCVFSEFWKARPGRGSMPESEPEARKEFDRVTGTGIDGETLVTAMQRFTTALKEKKIDGTRYSKSAAGFLRDGLWRQYAEEKPAERGSAAPAQTLQDWLQPMTKFHEPAKLRSWFKGVTFEDGKLLAPSKFVADRIRQEFGQGMQNCFAGIEIVVKKQGESA